MSKGVSRASEDVLGMKASERPQQSRVVSETEYKKSADSPTEGIFPVAPNLNPSLKDDPEFGPVYLIGTKSTEIIEEMAEWLNPVIKKFVKVRAPRKIDILNLKALSQDGEQGKIPMNFILKEYADEDNEITEALHRCSWFRIMFLKKQNSSIQYVVRGFSPCGKVIYYKECKKAGDKENSKKPTEADSPGRTIQVPKIPDMLLPL